MVLLSLYKEVTAQRFFTYTLDGFNHHSVFTIRAAFTLSRSTIETPEQYVKSAQS